MEAFCPRVFFYNIVHNSKVRFLDVYTASVVVFSREPQVDHFESFNLSIGYTFWFFPWPFVGLRMVGWHSLSGRFLWLFMAMGNGSKAPVPQCNKLKHPVQAFNIGKTMGWPFQPQKGSCFHGAWPTKTPYKTLPVGTHHVKASEELLLGMLECGSLSCCCWLLDGIVLILFNGWAHITHEISWEIPEVVYTRASQKVTLKLHSFSSAEL